VKNFIRVSSELLKDTPSSPNVGSLGKSAVLNDAAVDPSRRDVARSKRINGEDKSMRSTRFWHHVMLAVALGSGAIVTTSAQQFTEWSPPLNLGPIVDSAYNDQHPAISRDGGSVADTDPAGFDRQQHCN